MRFLCELGGGIRLSIELVTRKRLFVALLRGICHGFALHLLCYNIIFLMLATSQHFQKDFFFVLDSFTLMGSVEVIAVFFLLIRLFISKWLHFSCWCTSFIIEWKSGPTNLRHFDVLVDRTPFVHVLPSVIIFFIFPDPSLARPRTRASWSTSSPTAPPPSATWPPATTVRTPTLGSKRHQARVSLLTKKANTA